MAANWHNSREYRIWRARVIRRDKVCQVPGCGSIKGRSAHHMNSGSYFPDQRYDTDNGVTMCRVCHINFHTNFKRSYREKCTKYDFDNFISLASYFRTVYSSE
jgi:uncharacterized protein YkuJ